MRTEHEHRARGDNEFAGVFAVNACCGNCGRVKRFGPGKLSEFRQGGIATFEQLGRRLICRECRDRGKSERNVSLVPFFRDQIRR